MDTVSLFSQKQSYFEYLQNQNMCENTIWMNKYVINKFEQFCLSNQISKIENEVINEFYSTNLDYVNKKESYKSTLKRPIKAFLDYYQYRSIKKIYTLRTKTILKNKENDKFLNQFKEDILNNKDITLGSKNRIIRVIKNFLNYLTEIKVDDIKNLKAENVINYINNNFSKYDTKTISCYKYILNEFLHYLYQQKVILSDSTMFLSNCKTLNRKPIANSFSKEEIKVILDSIDTTTSAGKRNYFIMTLLSYYGLRTGDIVNLKFKDVDFEKNTISIIQQKTKVPLTLPLIEEVKMAILDYIKNVRPKDIKEECILITTHAPYVKYNNNSLRGIIKRIIQQSSIQLLDRISGSRVFRHSLATNMINDNIELYKIASILGHTNTRTTSNYITRNYHNLREITLKVLNNE